MGYDLHITRKSDWFDEDDQFDIAPDEWNLIVTSDPEIEMDYSTRILTTHGERSLFMWKNPFVSGEDYALFDFDCGNISVKNPDNATIEKMCKIALLLNAKVQGDDGELYEL